MERVAKTDLSALAKKILANASAKKQPGRATLITLEGNLGAGKTTLVQAVARELGVEEAVQSPTYVLMKKYELVGQPFKKLVHLDLYRLNDKEEFAALRPSEFLADPDALVCVEWPERVGDALPKADLELKLSSEDAGDEERYIEGV